jgi:dolichol kinase
MNYRKLLHFCLIFIAIFFCYFGKWKTIIILAPITAIVVSLDYMRATNLQINNIFLRYFGKVLKPHEEDGDKLCSVSYTLIATCITFFLFKKEIALTGFLIMAISDGLSGLVGRAVPSVGFFEKTASGSLVFLISAIVILVSCAIHFHMGFWFYLFGFFSVLCVTIIEARPSFLSVDDNLSIPLAFCILMTGFHFMWG